jgi:hypothetical protein
MRILIEGQSYLVKDLKTIFNDQSFYTQKGDSAIINSVGYYYSMDKKEVVYMLPKVFMSPEELKSNESENEIKCLWEKKNTVFKHGDNTPITIKELFYIDKLEGSIKHESKYVWIRHITISFYNSLIEFKRRKNNTTILNSGIINEINTNLDDDEYSYLDLVLSITNFYKKNKSVILFRHIEHISNQAKKPKWEKTIRKSFPIIDKRNAPIYLEVRNKKSIINTDEELIIYFFSILNHFKSENNLNISIDKTYNLIKGDAFRNLQINGLSKLRKIKYKYFSDTMKRMYKLCELYFDSTDTGSIKKRNEEFLSFKKYNIVFEDMVDKLFTDEKNLAAYDKRIKNNDINIQKLKNNDDGKIIDHLFEHKGLIDTSNIFYIGDSKYYKPGNVADKLSIYKQYTYAKNIIQYNINLFNDSHEIYVQNELNYRDKITEGYNITPNFLLYGVIEKYEDFKDICLKPLYINNLKDCIKHSYHWKDRLFDRDSLFICQYQINYLFVLNAYTEMSSFSLNEYRGEAKVKFRNKFIEYFSNKTSSNFSFHKLETFELKKFVNDYFKTLNGKCIRLDEKTLLVAIHDEEKVIADNNGVRSLTDLLESEILENYNIKQTSFEFPKENILQLLPYLDNENNAKFSIAADPKPKYGK